MLTSKEVLWFWLESPIVYTCNEMQVNLMVANVYEDLIRSSPEAWNRWRALNGTTRPILRKLNLEGCVLVGFDLHGVDLGGANLSKANLENVNLVRADLTAAGLSRANLRNAECLGADLSGANLTDANLCGAVLRGANFLDTVLGDTVIGDVDLRYAKNLEKCWHSGPSMLDHRTLKRSGQLPLSFLRGCGLPDVMIDYLPSLLDDPIQYYSCFISYSHADKSFARRLFDALQGRGVRCWLDEKQLLPGDDIHSQVDRGIRLWDKVLLCCSRHSLTSWWVDNEIESAFEKERRLMSERGTKVLALVPLDLDGFLLSGAWSNGKSQQVRSRFAADFTKWDRDNSKFESELERLLRAMRPDDSGRESPPPQKL